MKKKAENNAKWLVFLAIPFQMGTIIFAFTYLGIWLDDNYSQADSSVYTIVLSLISVFIALYNVIRQVKNLNNSKNE
ncbi:AtpZ/AtpI family protein [Flavobacterium sp. F-328]|uniref:AtpZ/AtpI family protein n=2 Tax=Flavobacterium TaxID=237 RepID=A0ABR7JCD2_9FLAO|nr:MULTISPECIES: AtpZ/AtpI family protein [Flavobacterium]MBC5862000.1 AtpZ/AtpI family protein [Flavobacterium turcicum]MBQ0909508.1 AtpZ/AtpI family protein [Flavobacterium erciyesense]NHL00731.1 AtpZ/AtpI family protein [Flavobacterium turcicum]